jgi:circadian clock protein KaiC
MSGSSSCSCTSAHYLGNKGVCTISSWRSRACSAVHAEPVDASYLADSVVLFRYFEHAGQVLKAISV